MNQRYTYAMILAITAGSVLAQTGQSALPNAAASQKAYSPSALATFPQRPVPGTNAQTDRGMAFYSEDFSGGGIPAGWTSVDDLTPLSDEPVIFQWSNDPEAVEVASVSFPEMAIFNAPGASDGYMWANSDRGLPSAPATDHLSRLTTSAIDCQGQSSVLLTMVSTIGVFTNDANEFVKVKVSTDLINWTEFLPFPCLVTGAATPPCSRFSFNPQNVAVNITSVAANEPEVYIQFEWAGGWDYWWGIDDVQLSPLPDNEIKMNYAYFSQTGNGEEYGRTPVSQFPAMLNIGAEIYNFGASEQTNVSATVDVSDGAGTDLTFTTDIGSIASGDTVLTDEMLMMPDPLPQGLYTCDYTVTSDQIDMDDDDSDNARSRTFSVTEFIYSLDHLGQHGSVTEVASQTGSGSFDDNSEDVKLLTYYPVISDLTVTGLEIVLGSATDVGSAVVVSILDTADVLATPSVVNQPLVVSETYVLNQGDVDAGVITVPFNSPITLVPNGYYAVASLFSVGENEIYIVDDETVPQPGLASALWIPFDPENNQNFYGGNGTAWAIRMTSDPTIGLQEVEELTGISVGPNPTNGILRINAEAFDRYTIEVVNVLGEQVSTTSFSGSTALDLSPFADGVYNVRISNGTKSTVRRITLN